MRSPKKARRTSLVKSIIEAVTVSGDEASDAEEDTRAKVVSEDEDDEVWKLDFESGDSGRGRSELRVRNLPSLADIDNRYAGRKVERKTLPSDDENEELTQAERDHANAELGYLLEASDGESEEVENVEREGNWEDIDHENDLEDSNEERREKIKIQDHGTSLGKEKKKGKEIKNQLCLWDNLMECRIQLQKVLSKINQFPSPETWDELQITADAEEDVDKESYRKSLKKCRSKITSVLDELMAARRKMMESNTDTGSLLDTTARDDEAPNAKKFKFATRLETQHQATLPYRNHTIEKWNDKTRLASRGSGQKSFAAFELSTLKQIEHILADKSRLVKRTQLRRRVYDILGQPDRENDDPERDYDEEIFDDDDFYLQLLRDLIEKKTDGADAEAVGQNWLQIQKLRSKAKRRVDTRASKGRKIRYEIHSKLVNFMAPVLSGEAHHQASKEAKQELFNSLFKSR